MAIDTSNIDKEKVAPEGVSSKPSEDASGAIRWRWVVLSAVVTAPIVAMIAFLLLLSLEWDENVLWPVTLSSHVFSATLAALLVTHKVKYRRSIHAVLSAILSIPLSLAFSLPIYIVIGLLDAFRGLYLGPRH